MLELTRRRFARGWSQAELARRARMHPATVSQIERGRLVPSQRQLAKLAQALGIDKEDLIFDWTETIDAWLETLDEGERVDRKKGESAGEASSTVRSKEKRGATVGRRLGPSDSAELEPARSGPALKKRR